MLAECGKYFKREENRLRGVWRVLYLKQYYNDTKNKKIKIKKVKKVKKIIAQELACSASYGVNKTILLAQGKKPSSQAPLVWNRPHISPVASSPRLHAKTEKIGKQQDSRKQQENPCHSLPDRNKINLA